MSPLPEVVVDPCCEELHDEVAMARGALLVRGVGIRRLPAVALRFAEICGGCGAVVLRLENARLSERIVASAWSALNSPTSSPAPRTAAEVAEVDALVASAERALARRR